MKPLFYPWRCKLPRDWSEDLSVWRLRKKAYGWRMAFWRFHLERDLTYPSFSAHRSPLVLPECSTAQLRKGLSPDSRRGQKISKLNRRSSPKQQSRELSVRTWAGLSCQVTLRTFRFYLSSLGNTHGAFGCSVTSLSEMENKTVMGLGVHHIFHRPPGGSVGTMVWDTDLDMSDPIL